MNPESVKSGTFQNPELETELTTPKTGQKSSEKIMAERIMVPFFEIDALESGAFNT